MSNNYPELDVEAALPVESDLALANLIKLNPAANGAHWADCLDRLGDSDAHLDVTEPIHEALDKAHAAAHLAQDVPPHIVQYVIYTLFYAHKRPPSPFDVQGKVEAVLDWMAANPQPRHTRGT